MLFRRRYNWIITSDSRWARSAGRLTTSQKTELCINSQSISRHFFTVVPRNITNKKTMCGAVTSLKVQLVLHNNKFPTFSKRQKYPKMYYKNNQERLINWYCGESLRTDFLVSSGQNSSPYFSTENGNFYAFTLVFVRLWAWPFFFSFYFSLTVRNAKLVVKMTQFSYFFFSKRTDK